MSERTAAPGAVTEWASDKGGLEWPVRVGLICYALVHLLIAWLALSLAFGDSSGAPDQQGALNQLAQNSLGAALLWAVAAGFAALVVWQGVIAWRTPRGADGKERVRKRATAIARAIVYAVLAVTAGRIAMGDSSSTDVDRFTRDVMKLPLGQLIVGLVGLAIVAVAVGHGVVGVRRSFEKHLRQSATGQTGRAVVAVGQIGYVAKGIAFGIVGALFVWAAVTFNPDKAGGLDVALRTLLEQSYGKWLLGAVALGIGCFGFYCLAWARDVDPEAQ